jgi:hypothetical protein
MCRFTNQIAVGAMAFSIGEYRLDSRLILMMAAHLSGTLDSCFWYCDPQRPACSGELTYHRPLVVLAVPARIDGTSSLSVSIACRSKHKRGNDKVYVFPVG